MTDNFNFYFALLFIGKADLVSLIMLINATPPFFCIDEKS